MENKSVLIVDPSEDFRKLFGLIFENSFDIVATGRKDEAYVVVENAEPAVDLVVMDLNLEDGSGLDLIRQIRTRNQSIPIIVVCQRAETYSETLIEEGVDHLFPKCFDLKMFLRAVDELVPGTRIASSRGNETQ